MCVPSGPEATGKIASEPDPGRLQPVLLPVPKPPLPGWAAWEMELYGDPVELLGTAALDVLS